MKRVENFHKTIYRIKKGNERNLWEWESPTRYEIIIKREKEWFNPIFQNEKVRLSKKLFEDKSISFGDRMDMMRKFDRTYTIHKWLWGEQNKYDAMAKKWEFQQAMISRDYKAVTLCDDVIGLVFEYL